MQSNIVLCPWLRGQMPSANARYGRGHTGKDHSSVKAQSSKEPK